MTFRTLLLRNLAYQWRGNLAILLGIALGTAVLTGALFVGDSLRGSLLGLSLEQLGWVEQALTPGRLFRQALARHLPAERSAPILMLQGTVSREQGDAVPARIMGVDATFWPAGDDEAFWGSDKNQVVLNEPLARALKVNVGDTLWLNVQKSENIPRETLLGKRKSDDVIEAIGVTVHAIHAGDMAKFSLQPSPDPARNAFVPLAFLQKRLNLAGKVNALLFAGVKGDVQASLAQHLSLVDWGLKLTTPDMRAKKLVEFLDPRNDDGKLRRVKWLGRVPEPLAAKTDGGVLSLERITEYYREHRRYLMLQSDHLYLNDAVQKALPFAVAKVHARPDQVRPVLVYLADALKVGSAEEPYATVTAVAPGDAESLKDNEIDLVAWDQSPLKAKPGDTVELAYYFPDDRNELALKKASFRVRRIVPLVGQADDPDWTPEYPGLTDRLDIGSWENPPFPPYSTKKVMERIKPSDEEFWKRHRATPKAYISLAAGQRMWATRFGDLTEVRLDLPADQNPEAVAEAFAAELLRHLDPATGGFVSLKIREQAQKASAGSNDFGVLFLSFSFFLIVAAMMLVGLLVRLNLERRSAEVGLLAATGWSGRQLTRLLLSEGALLTLMGVAVGLIAGRSYAAAMIRFLGANWPDGGALTFLTLHTSPISYAIGLFASTLVSLLTLRWAIRVLGGRTPRELLAGQGDAPLRTRHTSTPERRTWSQVAALLLMALAGFSLAAGFFVNGHEAQAGAFFGSGFLLLAGLLTLVGRWLKADGHATDPQPSLVRLGIRNAGRNPTRSLLTVGLLASATFLIVAVQAFHREPARDFFERSGGSGGFRLYAQTEVPVFQSLADPSVLDELGIDATTAAKIETIASLRAQPGDDASCLNLYQPLKPRVVGVPPWLLHENRFRFASSLAASAEEKANPWLLLLKRQPDGATPAILDANSAQWILKVSLGDTIDLKSGAAEASGASGGKLRVVGLLKESMFQSEVLVAEPGFLKLFAGQQGYQFFLIACQAENQAVVRKAVEQALAPQGVLVRPTLDRLAGYLAVENTYLSTFQALGGLGLLLGALGLAIVLVRGVWERRAELALLRALGFRGGQLAALVLAENVWLLMLGLGVGATAALIAVGPHLMGAGAEVLWGKLTLLLSAVTATGVAATFLAVVASLKTPVLTALRRE